MDPLTLMLITTGVTVLGGIITNLFNKKNVSDTNASNQQVVESTNQAQQQLAEQQHAWNVQDWQMQADYGSPSAQMQRFRAAGLNPSLIYGQMSEGPSINSTTMPELKANKAMPFLAENPVANLDPLSKARIDNIEANTSLTEAQAETENELREARKNNLIAATENLGKQNQEILSRIQRMAKENEFTDAQIKQFKFDNVMRGKYYRLDSQRFKIESKLADAQCKKLEAERQKALAEAKVTEREYDEMCWTYAIRKTGLANSVNLSAAQIAQARASARKLGIEADIEDWTAEGKRELTAGLRGEKGAVATIASGAVWICEDIIHSFGSILH